MKYLAVACIAVLAAMCCEPSSVLAQSCDPGYGLCGDDTCAPLGSVCCGNGTHCNSGQICINNGQQCLDVMSPRVCTDLRSYCEPGSSCIDMQCYSDESEGD